MTNDELVVSIKAKLEWANTVFYRAWGKEDIDAEADIEALLAEVERLRTALAQYADEHNWEWIWRHGVGPDWAVWTGPSKLAPDELAKAALDGKETRK